MRDFIRNDQKHELKLQEMLLRTIARAHELGDYGTVQVLEEVLVDREDPGYHLYSVLEDDILAWGMTHLLDNTGLAGDRKLRPDSKLRQYRVSECRC